MKRVLFVAYYFPPLGGIGSLRLVSFATHLADYGWQATVLAPRDGAYFRDSSLVYPSTLTIRTGSLELSRAGKQLLHIGGDDTRPATVRGARAALRRFVRRHLYFPDAQIGWYPPAVFAARRQIRRGDFDAIFSSSFPITAHLVARRLHRNLDLPWIAEYRDPWSAMLPDGSQSIDRALRLERAIATEASKLITVSPSWAAMFERTWGRQVEVIRNGHDGASCGAVPDPAVTLGYLGTYYPAVQDLSAIWAAVRKLNGADGPHVKAIRFVGELHPALERELDMYGLTPIVTATGFVSHSHALVELCRASVLLVAGPAKASGVLKGHVVAKLSEYLATSRPVIFVGDPNSDAADLVSCFPGTYVVATGDVEAALKALRESTTGNFERDTRALSRHALTGRLAALLDGVSS